MRSTRMNSGWVKSISSSDLGRGELEHAPLLEEPVEALLAQLEEAVAQGLALAGALQAERKQHDTSASLRPGPASGRRRGPPCRVRPARRTAGSRCGRRAPRAGAGSRTARWRWRRWSAGCGWCSSGGWRWAARGRRSRRRPASPCAPGTGARRRRATRRSAAGPRRRWCRRPATTCPSPIRR